MQNPNRELRNSEHSQKRVLLEDGIKNLDIMGEKFKLQYTEKGGKYRTRLGGCVSIIVAALALILLVFISSEFFDTSSPVVTTTRELSSSQSFNIVGKDLFSGLGLSFTEFLETEFFNLITVRFQLMRKSFNPQKNSTKTEVVKNIRYISCSESKDQHLIDLLKELVEDVNLKQFICPVFKEVDNNVTLSFDPQSFSSTYLSLKIYPCSLPERSQCYPFKPGNSMTLIVPRFSNMVSPSNYEDPVAFSWKVTTAQVDSVRARLNSHILEVNRIVDDRSVLDKPKTKVEYGVFRPLITDSWERNMTQVYCTSAMIDSGECEEYLEIAYELESEVVITKRRYKKIPALLGEFGGILKLLTTAFVIISFYYSKSIKSFLFDQTFGIKKPKAEVILSKVRKGLKIDDKIKQGDQLSMPVHKIGGSSSKGQLNNLKNNKIIKQEGDFAVKCCKDETLNFKTDVVELAKKMSLVDMLNGAYLKKHHKILLPLVILRANLSPTRNSAIASKKPQNDEKEKHTSPKNKDQIQEEENQAKTDSQEKRTKELSMDRNKYEILKQLKPRNSLESILNKQILSYLSLVYE